MKNSHKTSFSKDRPYLLSKIKPLKVRSCFQLGNTLYRTELSAAKKLAWGWILTKYAGDYYNQPRDIREITSLYGMECECFEGDSLYCPIHSRYNGYFKRLHNKCVYMILSSWKRDKTNEK